jgi:2-succinyl-5-enolpyruvyl-6-hydroxy-3-cyclohexene-1-carboxylate synthase
LPHGALLLAAGILDDLAPDAVLAVGRPTLSRGVQRLLGSAPRVHVVDGPEWTDPQRVATTVATDLAVVAEGRDEGWAKAWQDAAERAAEAVETVLSQSKWPTGLQVAHELLAAIPAGSVLFAGSSNPVRDLDHAATPRADVHVYANRGVAGIDGSVSSALGVALGTGQRGYALIGDLTFLHDSGGLLIGPGEQRPDVTIVVLNDDGGGIFTLLEQGAPEHADSFERVFGTPHGTDLAALCAAHGVPHVLAEDPEMFRAALAPAPGIRVVEVRADRSVLRDLHARLRAEVHARITG